VGEPNKWSMAVTVTLVFSDEAHRRMWLEQQGTIARELPPKSEDGYILDGLDKEARKLALRRIDYEYRRDNTDLQYLVGPMGGSDKQGSCWCQEP